MHDDAYEQELYHFRKRPLRPCVGIVLLNQKGQVWIGRRIDAQGKERSWQMPQGGIDSGEEPLHAAQRELYEETGISVVHLLAQSKKWYAYEIPFDIARHASRKRYRGQTQRWFAFHFDGEDASIDILSPPNDGRPEFDLWRWETPQTVYDMVVDFKKEVYKKVFDEFSFLFT